MLTADMDGVVGEMVAALKTKEMWADTLWFFQSDNGRSDHCPSFSRPFLALRCLPLQFCCPPLWPKINMRSNVTNHPQVLHTSTGTCTDKTCLMPCLPLGGPSFSGSDHTANNYPQRGSKMTNWQGGISRRRDCHLMAPPCTFIRCFNGDKQGVSSKCRLTACTFC